MQTRTRVRLAHACHSDISHLWTLHPRNNLKTRRIHRPGRSIICFSFALRSALSLHSDKATQNMRIANHCTPESQRSNCTRESQQSDCTRESQQDIQDRIARENRNKTYKPAGRQRGKFSDALRVFCPRPRGPRGESCNVPRNACVVHVDTGIGIAQSSARASNRNGRNRSSGRSQNAFANHSCPFG